MATRIDSNTIYQTQMRLREEYRNSSRDRATLKAELFDRAVLASKEGDVEALMGIYLSASNILWCTEAAIKHQQMAIFTYLMRICWIMYDVDYNEDCIDMAIQYDNREVLWYLVGEDMDEYVENADDYQMAVEMAKYGKLGMLQWWLGKGMPMNGTILDKAIEYTRVDVAQWIVETYPNTISGAYARTLRGKNKAEMLLFLHEWRIDGIHRNACESGECMVCKSTCVLDGWWMDNEEYTTMQQWLPREVIEDVVNMVV